MSYFSQETSTGSRKNAQNFLNSNPRIFGEIVHAGTIEKPATKCRVFSANFVGRKNSRWIKSLYVAAVVERLQLLLLHSVSKLASLSANAYWTSSPEGVYRPGIREPDQPISASGSPRATRRLADCFVA